MALATEKLYYRRNDTTYPINTYTALADVGTEAVKLQINGSERFVGLGDVGDIRASYLRVYKSGEIRALFSGNILIGTWTGSGTRTGNGNGSRYANTVTVYTSPSLAINYYKCNSETAPVNIRFVCSYAACADSRLRLTVGTTTLVDTITTGTWTFRRPTGTQTYYVTIWTAGAPDGADGGTFQYTLDWIVE